MYLTSKSASPAARTVASNIPTEIFAEIIQHLPIDEHLASVGLASKLLAPLILYDPYLAHLHINRQLQFTQLQNMLTNQKDAATIADWLPFNHRALLLGRKLSHIGCTLSQFNLSDNGAAKMIFLLLSNPLFFDPTSRGGKILILAIYLGFKQVIQLLIADSHVDPCSENNYPIKAAVETGQTEVVKLLLETGRVDPSFHDNYLLKQSAKGGRTEIMKLLLATGRVDPAVRDNYPLKVATEEGYTEIVCLLLATRKVDPTADNNRAFFNAVEEGHFEITRLLLEKERIDSSARNYAMRAASSRGFTNIVRLLLADPRVDPSAKNNYAIRFASANGFSDVVRLLLTDPRIDPTADNNAALRYSYKFSHTAILALLLADTRIDASTGNNYAICHASYHGFTEIVSLLLKNPCIDPSTNNNYAIRKASKKGNCDVVRLLLADPRVDPSAENNHAIHRAASNGYRDIVELLLADARVDPTADDNYAIRWACHGKHAEIVQLLLVDPRVHPSVDNDKAVRVAYPQVDPGADENFAIRMACENGFLDVVMLLLESGKVDATAKENYALKALTPFHLFAKLMEVIQLEDIKHHFKIYPKSFRGETAIQTMTDFLGFDKSEATECLSGVLFAQLIVNMEKPRDNELKGKSIYCLSVKGALVLRDVKVKRLVSETPESVYSRDPSVKSNIIYVDRDNDGNLVQCPGTMNIVFVYCLGERTPNFHKFENPNVIYTEGTPEVESADGPNGLVNIWPLHLKDKTIRLKGYTHAFSGANCVDWVLRCTSVVSRLEAIAIASYFVNSNWIMCVNPDDAATPVPGSPANVQFPNMEQVIKDSTKAVYQPTLAGAKMLDWDLGVDAPGVRGAVENFFRKKSEHPEPRTSKVGQSARGSVVEAGSPDRKSNAGSVELEGKRAQSASKSLNYIAGPEEDADLYGWESCHTHLISMDGTATRSKHNSAVPSTSSVGGTSASASNPQVAEREISPISKIIAAARPKVHAIKKQAAANHKDAPEYLPMDPSLPRDPLVLQLKEKTHNSRLVMILENKELCEQFCKYNYFMYSQENFNFWRDADAFRRCYAPADAIVIPGQPIRFKSSSVAEEAMDEQEKKSGTDRNASSSPPLWQSVAHAMAMYLKYIVDDGPYEINVGVIRKKNITATVATSDLMPFFELINVDSIIKEDRIEPRTVLLPGTEGMLANRLNILEKAKSLNINADLFDVAENHIFQLMATDSVPKFLKTTAYHNTMSSLIKAGTLKTFNDLDDVLGPRESLNRQPSNVGQAGAPSGTDSGRLSAAKPRSTQSSDKRESTSYEGPKHDLAKFAAEKKNSIVADITGPSKEESQEVSGQMVARRAKSKRASASKQYKITHKVAEHGRKMRKEAKKNPQQRREFEQ
ncbi:UNVERIFIED_CONTAM: hypothetical protein HDU68_007212, partial [Siphonaria sp. JEL0065]